LRVARPCHEQAAKKAERNQASDVTSESHLALPLPRALRARRIAELTRRGETIWLCLAPSGHGDPCPTSEPTFAQAGLQSRCRLQASSSHGALGSLPPLLTLPPPS